MKKGDTFCYMFHVTEEVYRGFISVFKDENRLHMDDAFARSRGFREKLMHGNILNGFLSFFVGGCLPTQDVIIHTQEITYNNPVYLNDVLKLHVQVVEFFDSVKAVELKFHFANEAGQKVAKGKMQLGLI